MKDKSKMSWEIFLAGALGGLARACYGAMKAVSNRKSIHLWYFFITIILAALLGGIIGSIFSVGKAVAALIGYAGTDVLENIIAGVIPKSISIKK